MSSGVYSKLTGYHNRRSTRLRQYDYARSGYYFVTICLHDRKQHLFGDVAGGEMVLNEMGHIVQNELLKTGGIRFNIKIDNHVVMPNHVHVIFAVLNVSVGAYGNTPLQKQQSTPVENTVHQKNDSTQFAPNNNKTLVRIIIRPWKKHR